MKTTFALLALIFLISGCEKPIHEARLPMPRNGDVRAASHSDGPIAAAMNNGATQIRSRV